MEGSLSSPRTVPLLDWTEDHACYWLEQVGYGGYEEGIREHGISGDVLSIIQSEQLGEIGVKSVGQRLGILKEVYTLKVEQGIEIGEDDWKPPSTDEVEYGDLRSPHGLPVNEQVLDTLIKQNARITYLELEYQKLLESFQQYREELSTVFRNSSRAGSAPSELSSSEGGSLKKTPSFKWATYGRSKNGLGKSLDMDGPESPRLLSPKSSEADMAAAHAASDPRLVAPETPSISLSPPKVNTQIPPTNGHSHSLSISGVPSPSTAHTTKPTPPPLVHLISATNLVTTSTPSPTAATTSYTNADSVKVSSSSSASRSAAQPSSSTAPTSKSSSRGDKPRAGADHPQKFRVTLEDPCWKVLPAALKKYQIDDDWKQYALFICYGTTERCLSYDEKPLLLFQKLKEAGQQPVFMLRHIRDIKSPIVIAQNKQAITTQVPAKSPAANGSTSAGTPHNPYPSVPAYSRNTRLHQAPVLQPISDKAKTFTNGQSSQTIAASNSGSGSESAAPVVEDEKDMAAPPEDSFLNGTGDISYAIAIYPYAKEREDEFEVSMGDTFLILSKAKGWWVVQRDPGGRGETPPDASKAGWVPAGCLLETSQPVGTGVNGHGTGVDDGSLRSPTVRQPILPLSIISSSYAAVALMNYDKKADDEMSLKTDEHFRVFKRYSHWSYAVRETDGERGWVPSWFLGRIPSPTPNPTTPTHALDTDNSTAQSSSLSTSQQHDQPVSTPTA